MARHYGVDHARADLCQLGDDHGGGQRQQCAALLRIVSGFPGRMVGSVGKLGGFNGREPVRKLCRFG